MRITMICAFFLHVLPFFAPCQTTDNMGNRMITENQAISSLRARSANARDAGFITIRKLEPTAITWRVAQGSWNEAQLKHLEAYDRGVLIDLLRVGGFIVLEFDTKTEMALKLHLITLGEDGGIVVQSQAVDGEVRRSEALMILRRSESFAEALNSSSSQMNQVLRTFGSAREPVFERSGGQGYFAVPERVARIAAQPDEALELSSLSGALGLWPIRYAPSMPVYAASPKAAVELALKEQSGLEKEFLNERGKNPDFINQLFDLESISTQDQLMQRLEWLRDLNSFLEKHHPLPPDSATYKANISISTIPLRLGVTKNNSKRLYAVMNAQGLISVWASSETGDFILRAVSDGID
jgi:hypothetical protein